MILQKQMGDLDLSEIEDLIQQKGSSKPGLEKPESSQITNYEDFLPDPKKIGSLYNLS